MAVQERNGMKALTPVQFSGLRGELRENELMAVRISMAGAIAVAG